MPTPRTSLAASGFILSISLSLPIAQAQAQAHGPAPLPPAAAVSDPQQFPALRGEVERLTLAPHGDIDGLILRDGTEVKTAPDLGVQLAAGIRPGDRVIIHGLKAAALPLVRALSITDETTHHTVLESRTAPVPPPQSDLPLRGEPSHPSDAISETSGKVRMVLHGPQGEVNGALLESGAILRFPADQSSQLAATIQPNQIVVAEGIVLTNAAGTVVDVRKIGPSREQLVAVSAPRVDRGSARPRLPPPPPVLPPQTLAEAPPAT